MSDNHLGDFLRLRRERVDPRDAGLRTLGHRRTPGLRREEVASLAGVSVEYLIRLERGRDRNPSPQVIAALADALRLDEQATAHLRALCSPEPVAPPEEFAIDPTVLRTLQATAYPAMIASRFFDLLALNESGAALYDGWDIPLGTNLAEHLFLHPRAEEIYLNREELAAETVGNLRQQSGLDPSHERLTDLIGRLSIGSQLFARLWALGDVHAKTVGRKQLRHPSLGELDLLWTTLTVAAAPSQMVVVYQGEPGSDTERALASLTGSDREFATQSAIATASPTPRIARSIQPTAGQAPARQALPAAVPNTDDPR
ncbi:helix-turn-helix domain-containing protein [Epidermidibacterium keratini]|uniref:Helix-turn-helix domain-containing protein n=1 Tax=Epidermidibacterium keratini TaxID=1891644 RepID=A0A7L4YNG1_9ACTN|nr:helix-turn-helix transcriptional regulator [Epidermidibacterium keratini]QHC00676.1 helix-turn-helix domain-containing protein [Epidermidibacterium keratini]